MDEKLVSDSYAARAVEYIGRFASIESVHDADLDLIRRWALQLHGPALDLGCGPGHLTVYIHALGVDVSGIDLVPGFIAHRQSRYPGVSFRLGRMVQAERAAGSVSGILAWYLLIHLSPGQLNATLAEFRRILRPGGLVLVGFFDAEASGLFAHQVVTAYEWPVEEMSRMLAAAGFDAGRQAGVNPLSQRRAWSSPVPR